MEALADDNSNVNEKLKFALGWVENIEGKGENAGYQHFLLFPQCFQKLSFPGVLKVWTVWSRVKTWGGGGGVCLSVMLPITIFSFSYTKTDIISATFYSVYTTVFIWTGLNFCGVIKR